MEEKIKRPIDYLDCDILVDGSLAKLVSNIYLIYKNETYDLLNEDTQIELF
jgi:hypothetical protein